MLFCLLNSPSPVCLISSLLGCWQLFSTFCSLREYSKFSCLFFASQLWSIWARNYQRLICSRFDENGLNFCLHKSSLDFFFTSPFAAVIFHHVRNSSITEAVKHVWILSYKFWLALPNFREKFASSSIDGDLRRIKYTSSTSSSLYHILNLVF